MVAITDDRISAFKESEFIASLKRGDAYGTTGPMISLSLSGTKMGDTFQGAKAELNVSIQNADWIHVDTVYIQVNGESISEYPLTNAPIDNVISHQFNIPMTFTKDSFVTIEVKGQATDDYATTYPEISPYAFSNPIYVDFDSDGTWQAPGL